MAFEKYLHDLQTLPADARLAYRHEGTRGVWKAVAARSVHRVFRAGRVIVFAQRLQAEIEVTPPAGVVIGLATKGDQCALASIAGQREAGRFETLIANGRHCLVAWRGEQPVGYAWVASSAGPDVMLWPLPFDVPSYAAYLWNLYVIPGERSTGIGSALARARLRLAWELGFQEGWRMIAPSNAASLRTVQKSGALTRVVGELRFIQLLDRTYSHFVPVP